MSGKSKKVWLGIGLLLIAAALFLAARNLWEASRAAEAAKTAAEKVQIRPAVPEEPSAEAQLPAEESAADEPIVPAYILDPEMEMPTEEIDGNVYIGTLEIPGLSLILPVMSQWSYPGLELAPCRYHGSAYLDDLIIAAHNYPGHFGRLKELEAGDEAYFSDMAGNTFAYVVLRSEQLAASAVEEMETGNWDLTLFTCTLDGKSRLTVRFRRV